MAGGHPIPDILDCTKTVLCTEIQNSRIENSRQKPEDCDKIDYAVQYTRESGDFSRSCNDRLAD